jgi:hypothetical protein
VALRRSGVLDASFPPSTITRMFISLPTSRPANSRTQSARHYPLTPSTVTPPSVSKQSSSAARRDSVCSDSDRARALLSRVASSPSSPRRSSPPATPKQHQSRPGNESQRHSPVVGQLERRYSDSHDAAKYWTGHEQRGTFVVAVRWWLH